MEVLLPVDDEDLEGLILTYSSRFQALLNKSRQSIKAGKGLSRDEFWQIVRERSDEQENEQLPPETG
jgi:hypothetical protein